MPKAPFIVTVTLSQDKWLCCWKQHGGSRLSGTQSYTDIKVAEAAAEAFAKSKNWYYVPSSESFLAIMKQGSLYEIVEMDFNLSIPKTTGFRKSTRKEIVEAGELLALRAKKVFVPDFIPESSN